MENKWTQFTWGTQVGLISVRQTHCSEFLSCSEWRGTRPQGNSENAPAEALSNWQSQKESSGALQELTNTFAYAWRNLTVLPFYSMPHNSRLFHFQTPPASFLFPPSHPPPQLFPANKSFKSDPTWYSPATHTEERDPWILRLKSRKRQFHMSHTLPQHNAS